MDSLQSAIVSQSFHEDSILTAVLSLLHVDSVVSLSRHWNLPCVETVLYVNPSSLFLLVKEGGTSQWGTEAIRTKGGRESHHRKWLKIKSSFVFQSLLCAKKLKKHTLTALNWCTTCTNVVWNTSSPEPIQGLSSESAEFVLWSKENELTSTLFKVSLAACLFWWFNCYLHWNQHARRL